MSLTSLYRHYDADGALLYVGISLNAVYRLSQHGSADWSKYIARVDIESYHSRGEAMAAEKRAIKSESPVFNTIHNRGRKDYSGKIPMAAVQVKKKYRPPADDGDNWLVAAEVRSILGTTEPAQCLLRPSAQMVIYLADGKPKGNIYFWRESEVYMARRLIDLGRQDMVPTGYQALPKRAKKHFLVDESLFTPDELMMFQKARGF